MQITEVEQELLEALRRLPVKTREQLSELAVRLAASATPSVIWLITCPAVPGAVGPAVEPVEPVELVEAGAPGDAVILGAVF